MRTECYRVNVSKTATWLSLCHTAELRFNLHTAQSFDGIRPDLNAAGEIYLLQCVFLMSTAIERTSLSSFHAVRREALQMLNECYELFLKRMSDEEFVTRLRDPVIQELNTPEYLELHDNAIRFSNVINQILREQAEKCPLNVRRALMF